MNRRSIQVVLMLTPVALGSCGSGGDTQSGATSTTAAASASAQLAPSTVTSVLYAQQVADIHIESLSGPVVGKIHKGAQIRAATALGSAWTFAVPRYTTSISSAKNERGQLVGWVEKSALGSTPHALSPEPPAGQVAYDYRLELWNNDKTSVLFDALLCGDFYVSNDQGRMRATQLRDGIEVTGVLDMSWPWDFPTRGENSCLQRLIFQKDGQPRESVGREWEASTPRDQIPDDYKLPGLPSPDPFQVLLRAQKSVFWLVETTTGLQCHEWRSLPEQSAPAKTPAKVESNSTTGRLRRMNDPKRHAWFRLDYTGAAPDHPLGVLNLAGPYFDSGGYRCARPFYVVGADSDRLYVDNPHLRQDPPQGYQLVGHHPDDVEHWYLSKAACELAKTRVEPILRQTPGADVHLGIHRDCFTELAEPLK
ncbi:MAG: hypothetical protein IPK82_41740 [Polyangiaceae bacterium]|nr:hypothetical protein [Polyangiaceae bacterium]